MPLRLTHDYKAARRSLHGGVLGLARATGTNKTCVLALQRRRPALHAVPVGKRH